MRNGSVVRRAACLGASHRNLTKSKRSNLFLNNSSSFPYCIFLQDAPRASVMNNNTNHNKLRVPSTSNYGALCALLFRRSNTYDKNKQATRNPCC